MPHFLRSARDNSGASLILFAVILPLLLAAVGIAVDIGRIYAVQSKAQNAVDAALLGAVSTISTTPLNDYDCQGGNARCEGEVKRLFNANYPVNYMGSSVSEVLANNSSAGKYDVTVSVTVPNVVMNYFGKAETVLTITSQVTSGYSTEYQRKLELAMVLDNSGSMSDPAGGGGQSKMDGLVQAGDDLTDILFGNSSSLSNINITVVPFNVCVRNDGPFDDWVQADFQARNALYRGLSFGGVSRYFSNRSNDVPPLNGYSDYDDSAPLTETLRFRTPYAYGYGYDPVSGFPGEDPYNPTYTLDTVYQSLAKIYFAVNNKSYMHYVLSNLRPGGGTRINVGLMWGMMALSPKWQGVWDPSRPQLPLNEDPLVDKTIILMTDGKNQAGYDGTEGKNDDNVTTSILCETLKSKNVTIYTIGFGTPGDVNEDLLRNCASRPSNYFLAPTNEELAQAFHVIADDINYNTLRLSR